MRIISAMRVYLIVLCLASLNVGLSQIVFEKSSSAVVYENTTGVVFDADATNSGGATDVGILYSLSGVDASSFTLDTENGELRFVSSPDWDAPTDADQNNIYKIEITANDDVSKAIQVFVVPKAKDGLGEFSQLGSDIDGEAENDRSGASVSMSADGSVVAIGATGNDGNGDNAGHVRVYAYDGTSWGQLGQDIDGEAAGDESGGAVSLSADGKVVAIGATGNDGNGADAGHVRIYSYNGTSWVQLGADIDGEAAGDESGGAVSLSADGKIVAIGVRNDGNVGHARVYSYNGTSWEQLGDDIDGNETGHRNGSSVSLSADGNVVAIGAMQGYGFYHDNYHDEYDGVDYVRVYRYDGNSWLQLGGDIEGDFEEFDLWTGSSVSLSADGSTIAIAGVRLEGYFISGKVRIYGYTGGSWRQLGDDIEGRTFSRNLVSLSADGKVVAIGEPGQKYRYNHNNAGIYIYDGTSWTQLGVDIDGEEAGDQSGYSVSLSADGTKVAIGAISNDGNGTDAGHVRVYNLKDITAPSITSVALMEEIEGQEISSNTTYSFEDSLWIAVTYDEKVRVTGEPSIALTSLSNKKAVFDTLISPDSTTAYFLYVISADEDDVGFDDEEVSLTVANIIDLNGGTIKDVAGNNAALDISVLSIPSQVLTNTNDNLLSTKGSTYPNPCTDRIQLDLGADFNEVLIEVFNSQGVLVKAISGYGKTHSIDLSELASGLYILSVNADGQLGSRKIMKE